MENADTCTLEVKTEHNHAAQMTLLLNIRGQRGRWTVNFTYQKQLRNGLKDECCDDFQEANLWLHPQNTRYERKLMTQTETDILDNRLLAQTETDILDNRLLEKNKNR